MENKTYKIKMFLNDEPQYDDISFVQNDVKSCSLELEFYKNRREKFDLTNCEVVVIIKKNDGTEVIDRVVPTNGKYLYELTNQALSNKGNNKVTIQAISSDMERQTFGTFRYKLTRDVDTDGISSSTDYPLLVSLISDAKDMQVSEDARFINESTRVLNESKRVVDENTRIANEVKRIANDGFREKDYADLKKIIVDENIQVSLQNQINSNSEQLAEMGNKKFDKNGIFTMANAGQDVKEAMTGGSVAVVGVNAVLTENIVEKQVTQNKTNFASFDRENYFYNDSLRFVTQSGANFTTSATITNRFLGEMYLEPNTKYNLICFNNSISFYLLEIYSSTALIQTIGTSGTIFSASGISFTTGDIVNGKYNILFRSINPWGSMDFINVYKYRTTKDTLAIDYDTVESNITKIKDLVVEQDNLKKIINNWNIKPTKWRYDKSINEVGAESSSTTQDATYFIPCFEDVQYFISHSLWVCFYGGSGTLIGSRVIPQSEYIEIGMATIIAPKGAKYLRFSVDKTVDKSKIILVPTKDDLPHNIDSANKKTIPISLLPQMKKNKSNYQNKKMVTDGDSLSAMGLWQYRVAYELGMNFAKNCGVSGTKVTQMCEDSRVANIPNDTDILYLLGGRNDFGQTDNATPLGTINDAHNNTTFYGAYQLWLDKIFAKIPSAKIIILTPPFSVDENTTNHLGFYLEQYRQAVRDVAYKYGCKIADLRGNMNINSINYLPYYGDDIHFNSLGAKRVGEVVIRATLDVEPTML